MEVGEQGEKQHHRYSTLVRVWKVPAEVGGKARRLLVSLPKLWPGWPYFAERWGVVVFAVKNSAMHAFCFQPDGLHTRSLAMQQKLPHERKPVLG